MTLTMSLVADGLIVQSADHRLVELPSGRVVDDAEKKQLVIQMGTAVAVVSFAGVGAVAGRGRASELLYDTAVNAGEPFQVSLDQLLQKLRLDATEWLRGVRGDWRRHSFVVAAIENVGDEVITKVSLVSNYQRINSQDGPTLQVQDNPQALDSFNVSSQIVSEPTVLVAGMHPAVGEKDRLALTRLVRDRRMTIQLARRMAYVNRAAASRTHARGMISPHCTTAAQLLARTQINGMTIAHTDQEREIPIETVMAGFDTRPVLEEAIRAAWRAQGRTDTPIQRGSVSSGKTLNGTTTGSPYANRDDQLFI
jgi:hypothetical protein